MRGRSRGMGAIVALGLAAAIVFTPGVAGQAPAGQDEPQTRIIVNVFEVPEEQGYTHTVSLDQGGVVIGSEVSHGERKEFLVDPGDYRVFVTPAQGFGVTRAECFDEESEAPSGPTGEVADELQVFAELGESVACMFEVASAEGTVSVVTRPEGVDKTFEACVEDEGGATECFLLRDQPEFEGMEPFRRPPGVWNGEMTTELGRRWKVHQLECGERIEDTLSIGFKESLSMQYGLDPGDKANCVFDIQDMSVPEPGIWEKRITNAWMECGEVSLQLKVKKDIGEGELLVKQEGNRVTFAGGDGLLKMNKEDGRPFWYYGKPTKAQEGVKKTETYYKVVTPKHMLGDTILETKKTKQGKCFHFHEFKMDWLAE